MFANIDIYDYVFYKIISKDKNIVSFYVGSTADWNVRKREHERACNKESCNNHNYKVYQFMRENGGWNNFEMVELGSLNNLNEWQARMTEQMYIDDLQPDLNMLNAFRWSEVAKELKKISNKKYNQTHKEKIAANKTIYYEKNKDHLTEYKAQWYEKNKEAHRARCKEYREGEHREELLAKKRDYYEKNKDNRNAKRRETYALKKLTPP